MKTVKIKTAEATGPALDWLVAKCEGNLITFDEHGCESGSWEKYSSRWSKGGPIIEREFIQICPVQRDEWRAQMEFAENPAAQYGPTALIAAMRCYVASKLGDEVEITEELVCVASH